MAKVDVGDPAPDFELAGHRREDLPALRLPRAQADPRLLPGRRHHRLHQAVLLLPRRRRPARRARRRGARDLAAVGRLARALGQRAGTERAAARRRGPRGRQALRRHRLARAAGPLHRAEGRLPAAATCSGRSSSSTSEGIVRHRQVSRTGASYESVDDLERGGRRDSADAGAEPAAVRRRAGADDPRRGDGGGAADRPLPRDHRDPALRPPRLAGAGARRPHGRSPTTPAATASPTPPRRGRVMDTRSWSPTSRRSSPGEVGEGPLRPRRPLDGRPHRGRLRAAAPRAARRAGRDRPGLPGRDLAGLARVLGRPRRRRWRRAASTASSTTSTATRGSTRAGATRCCASPASGCSPTAISRRSSRRCARCRARGPSSRSPSSSGCGCRPWSSPATTTPTPAIPTRRPPPTRSGCRGRDWSARGGRVAAGLAGRQALARVSRLLRGGSYLQRR